MFFRLPKAVADSTGIVRVRTVSQRQSRMRGSVRRLGSVALALVFATTIVVPVGVPIAAAAGGAYYVSTGGSDTNPGTLSQPFKTIQKAAGTAAAGDTVYVRAGTYAERVTFSKSGTAAAPIVIRGYDTERPVVTLGFVVSGSYVTAQQFDVTPGNGGVAVSVTGSQSTVRDIYVHDLTLGSTGITCNASGSLIDACRIIDWNSNQAATTGPAVSLGNSTMQDTTIAGLCGYRAVKLDNNSSMIGCDVAGPNEDILVSVQGSNVTVRGSKISKIGRRVGNDTHTEGLGIEKTSQSGNIHDIVIDGNVFANPPGQWNDPADGGRAWEGAPFWVFFFGMNTPTYTNITFTNNVFGDGVDRVWDQNPGPGVILGKRIVYNNLFLLGSDQLEDAWTWKNNIFAANPAFLNSGTVADHNLYVSPLAKPSSQPNSKSTTQGLAQLFVNPNVSAATRWGLDADWHLKAGSAAIDMPGIVDGNSPLVDASGSPRLGIADVGPFQFGASTPDTTPPTVGVTAPANGSTVSGSVALAATASDTGSGIARVEFWADGTLLSSDSSAPYTATWNASNASDGSHSIRATAYDVAGNSAASSVSVTVAALPADTTAPTVALTSPANGSTVSGSVALAATASDTGSGVARVEFRADGVLVGTDTSAPYAATWNSSGASVGSHTIQARAIDVAGNAANSSVNVTVPAPADTTAPTVALTSPANGSTVSGSVALAATASDTGSGVARVEFRADGVLVGTDTSAPYAATWNSSGASVGSHTIQARAIDVAGNAANSSVNVTVPAPADTTAPTVALTSPGNGAVVPDTVAITAIASDSGSGVARVEFRVDGTLLSSDLSAPYSANWDSTNASVGSHTIQARAIDVTGNAANSSVVVSVPAPPETLTPVYRLYNKNNGSHFYTASEAEKNAVLSSTVYSLDGVAYRVSSAFTAPLYRFYNKLNGSHFYTASEAEKNAVLERDVGDLLLRRRCVQRVCGAGGWIDTGVSLLPQGERLALLHCFRE